MAVSVASAALILYVAFLLAAFGWRTWIQWRATGDPGFRGFGADAAGLERIAGILFVLSLLLLLAAPIGALRSSPGVALPGLAVAAGVVLALSGFAVVLIAQVQMGVSWRIGVDVSERTELVTHGLFGLVRNPIFTGIGLYTAGHLLLVPNGLAALGALLGAIGLELQVRLVEEPYLLRVHGDAYGAYAREVGRFAPGVGRLKETQ